MNENEWKRKNLNIQVTWKSRYSYPMSHHNEWIPADKDWGSLPIGASGQVQSAHEVCAHGSNFMLVQSGRK